MEDDMRKILFATLAILGLAASALMTVPASAATTNTNSDTTATAATAQYHGEGADGGAAN
jgi:hypothetical protein